MKALFILLLLTLPLSAKTRTEQQEADLKEWIIGIQTLAQDSERRAGEAETRADQAEKEAQASRAQAVIARTNLGKAMDELIALQVKFTDLEAERDALRVWGIEQQKARHIAEAHVSHIKTWLGAVLGLFLALLVNYLPFANLYVRAGATVAAIGLGWLVVARFV